MMEITDIEIIKKYNIKYLNYFIMVIYFINSGELKYKILDYSMNLLKEVEANCISEQTVLRNIKYNIDNLKN